MKETMRLYPAVLIVVRKADEGVSGVLRKGPGGEVVVPDGAGMWISPYVMGRLARHWGGDEEDVKRYRPGRFEEARERGDSLDAYMPFGGGPRVCLGSRFAMLEGKILAAHILAEFRRRAGCRDEGRDCRERRRVAHSVRRGTDGVPRAAQNASQAAGDGVGAWPSMMINLFMRAAYFAYCV